MSVAAPRDESVRKGRISTPDRLDPGQKRCSEPVRARKASNIAQKARLLRVSSYRAAPPRDSVVGRPSVLPVASRLGQGVGLVREESGGLPVRLSGLAVTYSPTSWDAVPSAQRRLTAEFGMGSGVSLALMPPNLQNARAASALSGLACPRARDCLSTDVFGSMTSAGQGVPCRDWSACFRIGSSLSGD